MNHFYKCTHEDNRKNLCAACGLKTSFGNKKPEHFHITEKHAHLIRTFVNADFNLSNSKFPLSICASCRKTLQEHEKGNFNRSLPKMPNYVDVILPRENRYSDGSCNCYICLTVRSHGKSKVQKGRGYEKNTPIVINGNNGLYGSSCIEKLPVKQRDKSTFNSSFILCSICYQEKKKGLQHECKTSATTKQNSILKLIENLPEKQQDQIITSVLKRKCDEANIPDDSNVNNASSQIQLSTQGSKMRISVNPKISKLKTTFSVESLDSYQVNTSSSYNDMKKLTNFLRCNVGRNCIPSYYENHIKENSNSLQNIYKEGVYEFDTEKASEKVKRPVVWADAEELVESVIKERNFVGNINIKVMADGGQGFFKISLSLFPEDYSPKSNKKCRSLYSEGGTTGKKHILTSVNRLIMLCVVPNIKETYANIELLFKLTNINSISFKFVSDFKVLLVVNGQQTATASYPCPYCFISLKDLRSQKSGDASAVNLAFTSDDESNSIDKLAPKLKTYGDLHKDYQMFCFQGKNKKNAKDCHSTVNSTLFEENNDIYVIQKCVIPELHILQGYVNHLFWDGLVPLLSREKALLWPYKLKLVPKHYQGDIFKGNAWRVLLKKPDKLLDPEIYGEFGPLSLVPYVLAFKSMDKIVNNFFSTKEIQKVDCDLQKCIDDMRKAYESTGISITLKVHVILEHMSHCLNFLGEGGLGRWSEQAGETIHRNFLNYWNEYKINLIDDESYSKRLKKAVVEFSSQHL